MSQQQYMSLQGKFFLGKRDSAGNPTDITFAGNIAEASIELSTENFDHFESTSGQRLKDLRIQTQKSATFNMTIDEWTPENLALGLYGTALKQEAGQAVSDEAIGGTALKAGNPYYLANQNVTDVVIEDSTSDTPISLVAGEDYSVDLRFGVVQLLRIQNASSAPFVGPLKATYKTGATTNIAMFSAPPPERYARFEGVNTADGMRPVLLEMYRLNFAPVSSIGLISNELNTFPITAEILADASKPADEIYGQFARFVLFDNE